MQNPVPDKVGRTFICSIVFLDIVQYSTQTVAKQLALKGWLNDVLTQSLKTVSEVDRIILDTGDGVAMCFLSDPEEALFVSNNIRVALDEQKYPGLILRTGINLGPVKLVTDINGRPNIIGDGINVAQRVMSFAEPGQILVSRSYYEVVARLSDEYTKLFEYLGEHHDKHVRKHEVYEVRIHAPPDIRGFGTEPPTPAAAPVAAEKAPAAAPPAAEPAPAAARAVGAFAESVIVSLAKDLTAYLGPIAPLVVAKCAKKAASRDALVEMLADMIPIPAQRESFLKATGASAPAAVKRAAPVPAAPGPPASDRRTTETALPQLERLLATYIGPMAKILIAKAVKRARDDEALVAELAQGLDSESERAAFMTAAADLLAAHGRK